MRSFGSSLKQGFDKLCLIITAFDTKVPITTVRTTTFENLLKHDVCYLFEISSNECKKINDPIETIDVEDDEELDEEDIPRPVIPRPENIVTRENPHPQPMPIPVNPAPIRPEDIITEKDNLKAFDEEQTIYCGILFKRYEDLKRYDTYSDLEIIKELPRWPYDSFNLERNYGKRFSDGDIRSMMRFFDLFWEQR